MLTIIIFRSVFKIFTIQTGWLFPPGF